MKLHLFVPFIFLLVSSMNALFFSHAQTCVPNFPGSSLRTLEITGNHSTEVLNLNGDLSHCNIYLHDLSCNQIYISATSAITGSNFTFRNINASWSSTVLPQSPFLWVDTEITEMGFFIVDNIRAWGKRFDDSSSSSSSVSPVVFQESVSAVVLCYFSKSIAGPTTPGADISSGSMIQISNFFFNNIMCSKQISGTANICNMYPIYFTSAISEIRSFQISNCYFQNVSSVSLGATSSGKLPQLYFITLGSAISATSAATSTTFSISNVIVENLKVESSTDFVLAGIRIDSITNFSTILLSNVTLKGANCVARTSSSSAQIALINLFTVTANNNNNNNNNNNLAPQSFSVSGISISNFSLDGVSRCLLITFYSRGSVRGFDTILLSGIHVRDIFVDVSEWGYSLSSCEVRGAYFLGSLQSALANLHFPSNFVVSNFSIDTVTVYSWVTSLKACEFKGSVTEFQHFFANHMNLTNVLAIRPPGKTIPVSGTYRTCSVVLISFAADLYVSTKSGTNTSFVVQNLISRSCIIDVYSGISAYFFSVSGQPYPNFYGYQTLLVTEVMVSNLALTVDPRTTITNPIFMSAVNFQVDNVISPSSQNEIVNLMSIEIQEESSFAVTHVKVINVSSNAGLVVLFNGYCAAISGFNNFSVSSCEFRDNSIALDPSVASMSTQMSLHFVWVSRFGFLNSILFENNLMSNISGDASSVSQINSPIPLGVRFLALVIDIKSIGTFLVKNVTMTRILWKNNGGGAEAVGDVTLINSTFFVNSVKNIIIQDCEMSNVSVQQNSNYFATSKKATPTVALLLYWHVIDDTIVVSSRFAANLSIQIINSVLQIIDSSSSSSSPEWTDLCNPSQCAIIKLFNASSSESITTSAVETSISLNGNSAVQRRTAAQIAGSPSSSPQLSLVSFSNSSKYLNPNNNNQQEASGLSSIFINIERNTVHYTREDGKRELETPIFAFEVNYSSPEFTFPSAIQVILACNFWPRRVEQHYLAAIESSLALPATRKDYSRFLRAVCVSHTSTPTPTSKATTTVSASSTLTFSPNSPSGTSDVASQTRSANETQESLSLSISALNSDSISSSASNNIHNSRTRSFELTISSSSADYSRTDNSTATQTHSLPRVPYFSPLRNIYMTVSSVTAVTVAAFVASVFESTAASAAVFSSVRTRSVLRHADAILYSDCGFDPASLDEVPDFSSSPLQISFSSEDGGRYLSGLVIGNVFFLFVVGAVWSGGYYCYHRYLGKGNDARRKIQGKVIERTKSVLGRKKSRKLEKKASKKNSATVWEFVVESRTHVVVFFFAEMLLEPTITTASLILGFVSSPENISLSIKLVSILIAFGLFLVLGHCIPMYYLLFARRTYFDVFQFAKTKGNASSSSSSSSSSSDSDDSSKSSNKNGGNPARRLLLYLVKASGEWTLSKDRQNNKNSKKSKTVGARSCVGSRDIFKFESALPFFEAFTNRFQKFLVVEVSTVVTLALAEIFGCIFASCLFRGIIVCCATGVHGVMVTVLFRPLYTTRLWNLATPIFAIFSIALIAGALSLNQDENGSNMNPAEINIKIDFWSRVAVAFSILQSVVSDIDLAGCLLPLWDATVKFVTKKIQNNNNTQARHESGENIRKGKKCPRREDKEMQLLQREKNKNGHRDEPVFAPFGPFSPTKNRMKGLLQNHDSVLAEQVMDWLPGVEFTGKHTTKTHDFVSNDHLQNNKCFL